MEVVAFAHGSRQVRNVSTNAQRDPSRNIVGSVSAAFFLRAINLGDEVIVSSQTEVPG
jgi:hypothetical protein